MDTATSPTSACDALAVELLVAWPDRCIRQTLRMPPGSRVADLRHAEDLLPELAEAWDQRSMLGSFGQAVSIETELKPGDRIEILRPLRADPKEARRLRVAGRRQAQKAAGRPDRWTRDR